METWKIGRVKVSRVVEMLLDVSPTILLPDAVPENLVSMHAWLKPHFLHDDDQIPLSFHSFLIESEGARIVVDTCVGNDKPRDVPEWNKRQSDFLAQLAARGARTDAVDFVMCTHLHVDHVGWNTILRDGKWVPTFPKARYLFGRKEWEFWQHEVDPFGKEARGDSIEPILNAGLADLVESDHRLTSEVSLVPTPGHTPGHVSVLIESAGERAIITGDLFHHPVQFARPRWPDVADVDTVQAAQTRQSFMRRFSDGTLVLGTHFASPTGGRIVRDGDQFRFDV
ncbi:MAG TPA: MBL fold metallo-hydrolase [Pseudomonadales bacterium]|nr:MBL fold metallo-hydrolase [Pseudomonadales bacterium]